jgi:hypothetical protein
MVIMAIVRISQHIQQHVRQKFESMRATRVATQVDSLDIALCTVAIKKEMLFDVVEKAVNEIHKSDPEHYDWVHRRKNFTLRSRSGSLQVVLHENVYVPQKYSATYFQPDITVTEDKYPELYAHMEKIFARVKSINDEYASLRESLCTNVVGKCSTLRQVLELWPSAIDFMPEDVVQKHREVTGKRKNIVQEINVDDSIKASLAKERMIYGTK